MSFSYGELVMIGGFGAYYTFVYSGNFFLGVIGGFMASAVWGIVLYILCYKRFLEAPRQYLDDLYLRVQHDDQKPRADRLWQRAEAVRACSRM